MHDQPQLRGGDPKTAAARQIRAASLRRGWDEGELARRAGVSRTTLYYLRRGITRRPRAATLKRIARALGLEPEALDVEADFSDPSEEDRNWQPQPRGERSESFNLPTAESRRRFDRRTNPLIETVRHEQAELFQDWSGEEWDELYSLVGTGGPLSEEGVVREAARINRRRETVRRLHVVMETHLADVAERMVETLYELTRPQSRPQSTEHLMRLLASQQQVADRTGEL